MNKFDMIVAVSFFAKRASTDLTLISFDVIVNDVNVLL